MNSAFRGNGADVPERADEDVGAERDLEEEQEQEQEREEQQGEQREQEQDVGAERDLELMRDYDVDVTSWRQGHGDQSPCGAADSAFRDAANSTSWSVGILAKQKERASIEARVQLAKVFFTRQFKIRGAQGFGVGSGGGRPRKHDKFLVHRVEVLATAYGTEAGECKDFSPSDWWKQSVTVKQLYADNMWSMDIEPQAEDEGTRVDGHVGATDSSGKDTWGKGGTTAFAENGEPEKGAEDDNEEDDGDDDGLEARRSCFNGRPFPATARELERVGAYASHADMDVDGISARSGMDVECPTCETLQHMCSSCTHTTIKKEAELTFRAALLQIAGHLDPESDHRHAEGSDHNSDDGDDDEKAAAAEEAMLARVGAYSSIDGFVAMPYPPLSLRQGSKHVVESPAWMKKQRVARKFPSGWALGEIHSKKTYRKAADDSSVEWWVRYKTMRQGGHNSDYFSQKLTYDTYWTRWVFVKKQMPGACPPTWET